MQAQPDTCLYCGGPLPHSVRLILYCCEAHRRKAQDVRRKKERAEAKARKRQAGQLMRDPFNRNDLSEYDREVLFGNCLLDAAPLIGPGDREETLAKRAIRREETRKTKTRPQGKPKQKTQPRRPQAKARQLSLLDLPPVPEQKPLVQGRGWKKNWLTLC